MVVAGDGVVHSVGLRPQPEEPEGGLVGLVGEVTLEAREYHLLEEPAGYAHDRIWHHFSPRGALPPDGSGRCGALPRMLMEPPPYVSYLLLDLAHRHPVPNHPTTRYRDTLPNASFASGS